MNPRYIILLLGSGLFYSCAKFEVPPKEIGKTTAFKELVVDGTFNWKTTKTYNLKITGLETLNPVQAIFKIETSSGQSIYEESRNMSESFTIELNLPNHEQKIMVRFGSLSKEIALNSNEVFFNYTEARPAEITE